MHADPLTEGGRAPADIDRDIEDLPDDHPDQLGLRPRQLVVKSADRAAGRTGVVVLNEGLADAKRGVAFGVKGLHEEAAFVPVCVEFDLEDVGNTFGGDAHLEALLQK